MKIQQILSSVCLKDIRISLGDEAIVNLHPS